MPLLVFAQKIDHTPEGIPTPEKRGNPLVFSRLPFFENGNRIQIVDNGNINQEQQAILMGVEFSSGYLKGHPLNSFKQLSIGNLDFKFAESYVDPGNADIIRIPIFCDLRYERAGNLNAHINGTIHMSGYARYSLSQKAYLDAGMLTYDDGNDGERASRRAGNLNDYSSTFALAIAVPPLQAKLREKASVDFVIGKQNAKADAAAAGK